MALLSVSVVEPLFYLAVVYKECVYRLSVENMHLLERKLKIQMQIAHRVKTRQKNAKH